MFHKNFVIDKEGKVLEKEKAMKLYVIRHVQTNWNLKGIIQGQKDIELNDKGINEARKAKDEFNNLKIDLIMCSPLKRAKETAKILNEDKNINIIYKKELTERGLGNFEGEVALLRKMIYTIII